MIETFHIVKSLFSELENQELIRVERQARNEFEIETRVLNSNEAVSVIISEHELDRAFAEVRERFETEESFLAVLDANQ